MKGKKDSKTDFENLSNETRGLTPKEIQQRNKKIAQLSFREAKNKMIRDNVIKEIMENRKGDEEKIIEEINLDDFAVNEEGVVMPKREDSLIYKLNKLGKGGKHRKSNKKKKKRKKKSRKKH